MKEVKNNVRLTVLDYYDRVHEEFPDVPLSDIKKILLYGWKLFYLHNAYGGDVLIHTNKFWLYCGKLTANSLTFFRYYKSKLAIKIRVLWKRYKVPWDGYYYFALTQKLYEAYLAQKRKRGRPRKHFVFEQVIMYRVQDECRIRNSNKKAFFRYPMLDCTYNSHYFKELKTDKAELIDVQDPKKLSEVLISNYDYGFLTDKKKYFKKLNGK